MAVKKTVTKAAKPAVETKEVKAEETKTVKAEEAKAAELAKYDLLDDNHENLGDQL